VGVDWLTRLHGLAERYLGIPSDRVDEIVWTVVVFVLALVVRRAVVWVVSRKVEEPERQYLAVKTVNYVVGFVALLALLRIWLGGLTGIVAYLGILSAGIAIALQDPLTNLAGWMFLTIRKPFTVGDRIQIGNHAGDVIDLRLFAFSLVEIGNWVQADQSTGRILHIPNGLVFRQTVANYTQGFSFIWDEIPVTVTFESDWRKAKDLLASIAERHSVVRSEDAAKQVRRAASKYMIRYGHLTPIVWTSVADHGVTLTIRYLTDPRRRRSAENAIWEEILDAFAATTDIDFAYPTQRFYDNVAEGKPGRLPKQGDPPGGGPGPA
jgi:small-conductance mechanosensitive channel